MTIVTKAVGVPQLNSLLVEKIQKAACKVIKQFLKAPVPILTSFQNLLRLTYFRRFI